MLGLDFLLQVDVLRLKTRLFLLDEDAFGDVDEHRPGELAAGVGLRPPLYPQWLAGVLATEFEHDAPGIGSPSNGLKRVVKAPLGLWCVGDERCAICARDLFRVDAQTCHRRTVGPEKQIGRTACRGRVARLDGGCR